MTEAKPDHSKHNERMKRLKVARDKIQARKTIERGLLIVHTGNGPVTYTAPIASKAAGLYMICTISKHEAEDAGYHDALSEDSQRSLKLQGGTFSLIDAQRFAARPFAEDAMRLRRWDDAAKVAGASTPGLSHFLDTAARCLVR